MMTGEDRAIPWWEYLDWKEMGVVTSHYNIWSDETKEFVKKALGCDECYGWSPDVCEDNCEYHKSEFTTKDETE